MPSETSLLDLLRLAGGGGPEAGRFSADQQGWLAEHGWGDLTGSELLDAVDLGFTSIDPPLAARLVPPSELPRSDDPAAVLAGLLPPEEPGAELGADRADDAAGQLQDEAAEAAEGAEAADELNFGAGTEAPPEGAGEAEELDTTASGDGSHPLADLDPVVHEGVQLDLVALGAELAPGDLPAELADDADGIDSLADVDFGDPYHGQTSVADPLDDLPGE